MKGTHGEEQAVAVGGSFSEELQDLADRNDVPLTREEYNSRYWHHPRCYDQIGHANACQEHIAWWTKKMLLLYFPFPSLLTIITLSAFLSLTAKKKNKKILSPKHLQHPYIIRNKRTLN